jgi:leucyl aminopeptidase
MSIDLLPAEPRLDIRTTGAHLSRAELGRSGYVCVVVPQNPSRTLWRSLPEGTQLAHALRDAPDANAVPAVATRLANAARTPVGIAVLKPDESAFERLTFARKLVAHAIASGARQISLLMPGIAPETRRELSEAITAAALAAIYPVPTLKRTPVPPPRLRALVVHDPDAALPIERLRAEAAGNGLARWLGVLPPNELTMRSYRTRIEALAREHGWDMDFLDERALAKRKAGAFLAVAQGNATRDAGIAYLRYRPRGGAAKAQVALVGKGICFDTGGTNLKTARGMQYMHEDMLGSAVALGTLLALTRIGVPFSVDCWLAITENRLSPAAYKPQDVVTASNGTTIEVIHTDAEGRMALADALALASREKPQLIIDYATLTGACVNAVTERYSGAFTNRRVLETALVRAGRASGERVWPFPLDSDFDEPLEGQIADIKQCVIENEGDHILAARFLSRFVGSEVPWVHIDLASARKKGGLGHVPTDVTGFGVRYTLAFLLDEMGSFLISGKRGKSPFPR